LSRRPAGAPGPRPPNPLSSPWCGCATTYDQHVWFKQWACEVLGIGINIHSAAVSSHTHSAPSTGPLPAASPTQPPPSHCPGGLQDKSSMQYNVKQQARHMHTHSVDHGVSVSDFGLGMTALCVHLHTYIQGEAGRHGTGTQSLGCGAALAAYNSSVLRIPAGVSNLRDHILHCCGDWPHNSDKQR
jgi:hypothetical protein